MICAEKRFEVKGTILLAVLAVLVLALAAFTGCSKGANDPAATASPEPVSEYTDAPASTETAGDATGAGAEATPEITAEPTSEPTVEPTPELTEAPTEEPTGTPEPTQEPTSEPTAEPTAEPTEEPTAEPTSAVTPAPGQYITDNSVTFAASTVAGENSVFSITQDFKITFINDKLSGSFNRMSFTYTSDKPLKLTAAYTLSGSTVNDGFFLEAGENVTFRGLISKYLEGKKGAKLQSLTLSVNGSGTAQFKLSRAEIQTIDVYSDVTRYIENSRFKVGVKLSWGGGINYIQDKTLSISGVTNLVNQADTGRLIQQSYYGTGGNSEYTPGEFNGSKWAYNPVQGGDKYGNSSRLIDVEVGDNYIYIKAQPQDWSLNGQITPSYMENRYTVTGEYIRVDNRFVDFSGWTHRYAHQELPAFYTISYLDKFVWYNGDAPWTDAPLSVRANLQFWGDANYANSCRFYMYTKNTETWCAWVSSAEGAGIGLYVPNIDQFYAGRYNYNGSKDPANGSTNYVAPLNTLKLVSFVPIEYSYLITTGTAENIRATFKANKDFATNASLHTNYQSMRTSTIETYTAIDYANIDFTQKNSINALDACNNSSVSYSSSKKAAMLKVTTASDPQVMVLYSSADSVYNADDYTTLEIEYMLPASNALESYVCDLFLCTGSQTNPSGDARVRGELIKDGEYHTLTIDLSGLSFWSGKINKIRFDFVDACETGDTMYLKAFRLK